MKNKLTVISTAVFASFMLLSSSAIADPGGHGNGKGHGNGNSQKQHETKGQTHKSHGKKENKGDKGNKHDDDGAINVTISVEQARDLARRHGLVGYQSLPPGIAKNLARGKPLPPGIAKKAVPANMLSGLPHYPGYDWYVVGDDLVLVAATTMIVNSVLQSVFN